MPERMYPPPDKPKEEMIATIERQKRDIENLTGQHKHEVDSLMAKYEAQGLVKVKPKPKLMPGFLHRMVKRLVIEE